MEHSGSESHSEPKKRRFRRPRWIISSLVVVAAVVVGGYFGYDRLIRSDDVTDTLTGNDDAFTIEYPKTWRTLSAQELQDYQRSPLAVLRRKDDKGFVVIRREGKAPSNLAKLTNDLTRRLKKQVPDFQPRRARRIKVKAGNAYLYSYIRKRKGTVHLIAVVPDGKRSFTITTASQGGANNVAGQIGAMVLTFDTKKS